MLLLDRCNIFFIRLSIEDERLNFTCGAFDDTPRTSPLQVGLGRPTISKRLRWRSFTNNDLPRTLSLLVFFVAVAGACEAPQQRRTLREAAACGFTFDSTDSRPSALVDVDTMSRVSGIASIAAIGDSEIAIFELTDGKISRLDPTSGVALSSFGRLGEGPGEFVAPGRGLLAPSGWPAWIVGWPDSIGVFDGRRLQTFTSRGELLGSIDLGVVAGPAVGLSSRVSLVSSAIVFDRRTSSRLARSSQTENRRVLELLSLSGASATTLARFELPPLPTLPNGSTYEGFSEARPVWTSIGECLFFANGSTGQFLIQSLDSTYFDTLHVDIQESAVSEDSARARAAALLGLTTKEVPPPVLQSRFTGLAVDRRGWLWIQLVESHPAGAVSILRHNPRTGHSKVDTFPAFPSLIAEDGSAYGFVRNDLGERYLLKLTFQD